MLECLRQLTLTWGVTEGDANIHDWIGLFKENDIDTASLRHVYCKVNRYFLSPFRMDNVRYT